MIKDPNIAASVSKTLQRTFDDLGASLVQVKQNCDPIETAHYKDKIGDLFYILVFDLLEPLYKEHPNLKPSGWDAQEHELVDPSSTVLPKTGA